MNKIQNWIVTITATVAIFLLPAVTATATEPLLFSGLMYSQYSVGKSGSNIFDISRLYLTGKQTIGNEAAFRITTDIRRANNNNLYLYTKYAYISLNSIVPQSTVFLGLHYLPLLAYEEGVWGYRSASKVMMDLQHKQTSADIGIGLRGKISSLSYALSVVNGEGYAAAENDKQKAVYGQLSKRMNNVEVSLFSSLIHDKIFVESTSTFYIVIYGSKMRSGLEVSSAKKDERTFVGGSIFNVYQLTSTISTILRSDTYLNDIRSSKTRSNEFVGISYKYNNNVMFTVDYQTVQDKQISIHLENIF